MTLIVSTLFVACVATGVAAQVPQSAVQAILARLAPGKTLPNDLIITGQLTDPSGVVQPFRITTKGKDQVLYETGTGPSHVSTTTSKGNGWTVVGNKFTLLKTYTAMQRLKILPFLDLLAEADAPSLQVTDKGPFLIGTIPTRLYTLRLPDPTPNVRLIGRPFDEQTDFYVDPASSLVVRSVRLFMAENSMDIRTQVITDFSDYRNVQGFAIPFRIVETSNFAARKPVQALYVIQNVTVNSSVPDSTFAAPGAKK
jgi:hypothetical protein